MRDTQPDTPLASIDEILLIQQIHHVKPQQQLLIVPRQRDDVREGHIIDRVRGTMGGVCLPSLFRRAQPRGKQRLTRERRPLQQTIGDDRGTRQGLLVIAMHPAFRVDVGNFCRFEQDVAGLEPVPFTLPPGHIAARRQVIRDLEFQGSINAPGPTPFKGKVVQQGRRPKLACIGQIVGELVIPGQL